jgi:hypothetical protein
MVTGIGIQNESSLHFALKMLYKQFDQNVEEKVESYIVDVVGKDILIEIQTKNFSAISKKLRVLLKKYKIKLVHPIAEEKWITYVDKETGEILSKRKSPKKGSIYDLFYELVRVPDIFISKNLSIDVLLIREEEIRCNDGLGSWRRKGVSIIDRRLINVIRKIELLDSKDLLTLIPENLEQHFSNKGLAACCKIPIGKAQKMTYCLKKMSLINQVGKKGNELLFQKAIS